ncbi:segregation and condensation protein A [Parvularcula oceani]|uniref:segregation and condensation protein A n=1 Tax=Parvularcula oceani TaxID=1247963 RepID=UPI0005690FEF|nr:ScpA family protein [Parvularcula oceani]
MEGASEAEDWDRPPRDDAPADTLVVHLDGFEGPLSVLLDLAQRQKVDLRQISVLALVDQYLDFIDAAKREDLDLAADYLVMASWLTYLKSRLLLPKAEAEGEEPTADEMAAQLAFQLQRLDAMRKAADALMALPQTGRDVFPRGERKLRTERHTAWQAELFDLLKAYARQRVRGVEAVHRPEAPKVLSVESARAQLADALPKIDDWRSLAEVGTRAGEGVPAASITASTFNAALELAKDGRAELRQENAFSPLFLRGRHG